MVGQAAMALHQHQHAGLLNVAFHGQVSRHIGYNMS